MPFDGNTFGPYEPIFTWINEKSGQNINIASKRLFEHLLANPTKYPVAFIPVWPDVIADFLAENCINEAHAKRLTADQRAVPIILGHRGTYDASGAPDVMFIDGHHRYYRAFLEGDPVILTYLLTPSEWYDFSIVNLPKITKEELKEIAPKPDVATLSLRQHQESLLCASTTSSSTNTQS